MINSEISKLVGAPPSTVTGSGMRSDNEASKRSRTVSLGGFFTPDTRRLGFASDGVSAPSMGSGPVNRDGGVSQAGRARRAA